MDRITGEINHEATKILAQCREGAATVGELKNNLQYFFRGARPFKEGTGQELFALVERATYQKLDEIILKMKIEP